MKKNSKNNQWKKISSKVVYQNPWISVREDEVIKPDGSQGIYGVVDTSPAVFIVPIDEAGNTYLIGQFRYTSQQFSWEVPAGGSGSEDLHIAAHRELQEETGFKARNIQQVGSFFAMNGVASEESFVFIAQELTQTDRDEKNKEGITEIKRLPFHQVFEMIQQGEITDGQSISALTIAAFHLGYTFQKKI